MGFIFKGFMESGVFWTLNLKIYLQMTRQYFWVKEPCLKALKNYEASNFERNNNGAEEQYEMVEIIEKPSSPPTKRACFFL